MLSPNLIPLSSRKSSRIPQRLTNILNILILEVKFLLKVVLPPKIFLKHLELEVNVY